MSEIIKYLLDAATTQGDTFTNAVTPVWGKLALMTQSGRSPTGNATTLAIDQSFAKLAAPLDRKPALFPNSWRAPLEKVLAIWVSRKRDLDSSIIQNLARHEFYKFIDVSAYSIVMGVWQMQEKV